MNNMNDMNSIDLLGGQINETVPTQKNNNKDLDISQDASFKNKFDQEVSRQYRQTEDPEASPSKHVEAEAPHTHSESGNPDDTPSEQLAVTEHSLDDTEVIVQDIGLQSNVTLNENRTLTEFTLSNEWDLKSKASMIDPTFNKTDLVAAAAHQEGLTVPLVRSELQSLSLPPNLIDRKVFSEMSSQLSQAQNPLISSIDKPNFILDTAIRIDADKIANLSTAENKAVQPFINMSSNLKPDVTPTLKLSNMFPSISSDGVELLSQQMNEASTVLTSSGSADKIMTLENTSQVGRFAVNVQFGRTEWNDSVAQKVAQMAAQNLKHAEIQLDPPELGPLQVRVHVNSDQAAVSFTSHSSQVRDALEQNSQRLKELFEAEGFDLVDVDVGSQQKQAERELDSDQAGENTDLLTETSGEEQEHMLNTEAVIQQGVDQFV